MENAKAVAGIALGMFQITKQASAWDIQRKEVNVQVHLQSFICNELICNGLYAMGCFLY